MMLITITGPSGSGKGFIKEKIIQKIPSIKELSWLTTRPPRNNNPENNRINIGDREFEKMMGSDQLILVQKLYGNFYGLRKNDLLMDNSEILFTELHIDNFLKVANQFNFFSIALMPTSLSILENRLKKRETEDSDQIKVRISVAKKEVQKMEENRALFSITVDFSGDFEKSSIAELLQKLDYAIKGGWRT